jgi:hypothetical protein
VFSRLSRVVVRELKCANSGLPALTYPHSTGSGRSRRKFLRCTTEFRLISRKLLISLHKLDLLQKCAIQRFA